VRISLLNLVACTWKTKMADVGHWSNLPCRNTAVVCSPTFFLQSFFLFCFVTFGLSKNVWSWK
jgi:hypothetical protein